MTSAHNHRSQDRPDFDVVVVGAGLAGLTAAATASNEGRRVAILSTGVAGGRAATTERAGFRFNQGPHALYVGGPGMRVLRELGIDPKGGPPALDRAHALWSGTARPLPTSAARLATSSWLPARARYQFGHVLSSLGRMDLEPLANRSVTDWLAELELGPEAERLLALLVRLSTYSDDPGALSADTAVSQLRQKGGVLYLHGGWRQLVDALTRPGTPVLSGQALGVQPWRDGWEVRLTERTITCSAVVIAAGSPAACRGLLPTDPRWGPLGPPSTAACLDLGLRRAPDPPILLGADDPLYLSTHCPPADLAPAGHAVVQVMRYGARSAIQDRLDLENFAGLAGISEADIVTDRFLARMVTCSAVPTPSRGGLRGRPAVDTTGCPGVFVAGDWVGPEGHLADASLASGASAGRRAAAVSAPDSRSPVLR